MVPLSKNNSKKSTINLDELYEIIRQKIDANDIQKTQNSYSAKLAKGDIARLAQKIGEEGVEVTIASIIYDKDKSTKNRHDLINEICDLFYHNLVLLARNDIKLTEIFTELYNRNKTHD